MTDTSKVRRTAVVDEIQELSQREMADVTGGGAFNVAIALIVQSLPKPEPEPEPEPKPEPTVECVCSNGLTISW